MILLQKRYYRSSLVAVAILLLVVLPSWFLIAQTGNLGVQDVSWSSDGQYIAVGYADGTITVSIPGEATPIFTSQVTQNDSGIRRLEWNYNNTLLAAAARDGFVYIINVNTLSVQSVLREADDTGFLEIRWHPHQNLLASTSRMGTLLTDERTNLKIWNVDIGTVEVRIEPVTDEAWRYIFGLDWDSDGQLLAFTHDRTLYIWDLTENSIIQQQYFAPSQTEFPYGLNRIAWQPNTSIIAIADFEGGILLWDTDTEQLAEIIPTVDAVDLDWSEDGNYLAFTGRYLYIADGTTFAVLRTYGEQELISEIDWSDTDEIVVGLNYEAQIVEVDQLPTVTPTTVPTLTPTPTPTSSPVPSASSRAIYSARMGFWRPKVASAGRLNVWH
jgi:WD40 repeat protein